MHDLAILIGNLGSDRYLADCLRSLKQEDAADFSWCLHLAFNGFEDTGFVARIAAEFPEARAFYRRSKLGYTGTYNRLLAEADARYMLLLDDDTLVPKGTLPAMVAFMDAHPEVGIAGCRTLNPDGSLQRTFGRMLTLHAELFNAVHLSTFWPDHLYRDLEHWREVDWLNGSFMLVRRETLQAVGHLDEYYYTFCCEPDWCLRIARAGWKVAFVPDVAITHVGGDHSINGVVKSDDALMRAHINHYYFFRKHYGLVAQILLRPILSIGASLRLIKFIPLLLFAPGRRAEAAPKVRAYVRIALLGLMPRPWRLTTVLSRQNAVAKAEP